MDVEKTIQFLIGNAAQHDARIAAAEKNIVTLGNSLITLTSVVKTLAETTHAAMEEMRERDARLDAMSRERDAALDERISKLVSAIAALVNGRSNQPPAQH